MMPRSFPGSRAPGGLSASPGTSPVPPVWPSGHLAVAPHPVAPHDANQGQGRTSPPPRGAAWTDPSG